MRSRSKIKTIERKASNEDQGADGLPSSRELGSGDRPRLSISTRYFRIIFLRVFFVLQMRRPCSFTLNLILKTSSLSKFTFVDSAHYSRLDALFSSWLTQS